MDRGERGPGACMPAPPKPKLLDQVRDALRRRHYSYRTEESYVHWIKRFILFYRKRHPADMGKPEIEQFLTALAVQRRVAASTQNQALAAILFLYKEVLRRDPGWLDDLVRAKRPRRLPVVLTRQEVEALLAAVDGVAWIMAMLPYGSGLRLMECLRLLEAGLGRLRQSPVRRAGAGAQVPQHPHTLPAHRVHCPAPTPWDTNPIERRGACTAVQFNGAFPPSGRAAIDSLG